MAYRDENYIKTAGFIISVYNLYKSEDIPDTQIVRNYFPKHFIFIKYRQWMNIKGLIIPREYIIDSNVLTHYESILNSFKTD